MSSNMKEFLIILSNYLKSKRTAILTILLSFGIFLIIFSLYSLPLEAVVYAALLSGIFIFCVAMITFTLFYKKHKLLKTGKDPCLIDEDWFPKPKDLIEGDYQRIIQHLNRDREEAINKKDRSFADMLDYYTIWGHQIKTPIAAMRLILQSDTSDKNGELMDQLFKVEQYVEMVLQYLRMENMSADLMFKRYSLDEMVKQGVRKYAKPFIRKKIKLNYEPLNRFVLTDEKWLVFVIEQVLSNALKYTNNGEILIYMDLKLPNTLVIEDTGIGIEQEDLPRVFEKGFTGYNGRTNKKSTGIGLYLCKQILSKLSHTIEIESVVGKGTKVKIGLDTSEILLE